MIRTVGRLLSLRCGRQPGKAGKQRQGDGKEGLKHSVHMGMKEAEHSCLYLFRDLDGLAQGVSQILKFDDNV